MNQPLKEGDLCIIVGCRNEKTSSNLGRVVTLKQHIPANTKTSFNGINCSAENDAWIAEGQNLMVSASSPVLGKFIDFSSFGVFQTIHLRKINENPDVPGSTTHLYGDKERGVLIVAYPDE